MRVTLKQDAQMPPRARRAARVAYLVGDGPDALAQAHHELAQLGVGGGRHKELLEAVAELDAAQAAVGHCRVIGANASNLLRPW
jgi:hypothetical protein